VICYDVSRCVLVTHVEDLVGDHILLSVVFYNKLINAYSIEEFLNWKLPVVVFACSATFNDMLSPQEMTLVSPMTVGLIEVQF